MSRQTELDEALVRLTQRTGIRLRLERWSPGDGWTRYRITAVGESGAEWEPFGSRYRTVTEIESFIQGLSFGLWSTEWISRLPESCKLSS